MYSPKNTFRFEGNLGKDAELKQTPSGPVVAFSVAVNERWTDTKKIEHKRTDWFDVEVWGNQARTAATLRKGTPVIVEGKVKTDSYTKNNLEHRAWVIKANSIRKIDYTQAAAEDETGDANEDA